MKKLLLYTALLVSMLTACGQSSNNIIRKDEPITGVKKEKVKSSQPKGDVLIFVKHKTMDNEGTGLVAATCLIPEGWTIKDKLYWEYKDPTVPIRFESTLQKADGKMLIQSYPDSRHSWYTGPSGSNGYRPPSDIIDGLKFLIKIERKGKVISYVDQKILADQHQNSNQQGSLVKATYQLGMVRVEYAEDGQTMEEEFYGQLDISDVSTPTALGNSKGLIWGASNLYSLKAPKGSLNECRKIAQTVRYSARITKPFYNRLAQVMRLLSDQYYQQIYQAGQISKIISQTNDQMIANIDASYRSSQKSADRTNNQFSDYMRGVDRWTDGGSEVQLPSGYSDAWVNDRGEYLLSNTHGYNPGTDYGGSWKELGKKQ